MPSVLIVDDHASFRATARTLLARHDYEVVGEAADAAAALAAVRRLRPDIVLLDIQLPGRDGISVAEELALDPDAPVVVLTSTRAAVDHGRRLRHAQARGFIPKDRLSATVLDALLAGGG